MMMMAMAPETNSEVPQARSETPVREMQDQFILPELYCPFPSAVNPHAETVGQQTIEWARGFKLLPNAVAYQQLDATRVGLLTGRAHPTTPLDALQLITDWTTWLFILDDSCDELGVGKDPVRLRAIHQRTLAILRGQVPSTHDSPMLHAVSDLRSRLLTMASSRWMTTFIQSCEDSLDASIWEAQNRARGVVPDVLEYIRKRAFTGGMYPYVALFQVSDNIHLGPDVVENPSVVQLTRMAINVVCWSNDIFSLSKEMQAGDVHNLVLTLQHKYRLTLQEAGDRAAALHNAEVRAFINLEQRLPSFGAAVDAELTRYVAALRSWMQGNLDWSYTSYRYLLPATMVGGQGEGPTYV